MRCGRLGQGTPFTGGGRRLKEEVAPNLRFGKKGMGLGLQKYLNRAKETSGKKIAKTHKARLQHGR